MTFPGKRIWRRRPVVVFSPRRVAQLSFSKLYSNKDKVMAPVSNPDKDLDAADGGEAGLMAFSSAGFQVIGSIERRR